jgi:hypothetical protein
VRYLSVCAIVKDENSYLPEWIAYHRAVGVEHFYIYDNESGTPVARTLGREVGQGVATVMAWKGKAQQGPAYEDCLARRRRDSFWIAFVDVDEFLLPKKGDSLPEALRGFEPYGGVGFNWQTFGSAGLMLRPVEQLQIEAFTRRSVRRYSMNNHVKSVVQPRKAGKYRDPHSFAYEPGAYCVNERGQRIDTAFNEPPLHEVVQVNHYIIRSREEAVRKARRGAADGSAKTLDTLERWDRELNIEEDRDIVRFAPAVRKALGR